MSEWVSAEKGAHKFYNLKKKKKTVVENLFLYEFISLYIGWLYTYWGPNTLFILLRTKGFEPLTPRM